MKSFVLHWLDGKTEAVSGDDIADACRNAGIGHGALLTLDYYHEEGKSIQVAGKPCCGCDHAEEGVA